MNRRLLRNIASDTNIICNSIPPYSANIKKKNNTINDIEITDYSRCYIEDYMQCTIGDSLLLLVLDCTFQKNNHGSV